MSNRFVVAVSFALSLHCAQVSATALTNGGFDSGLAAWNDASGSGGVLGVATAGSTDAGFAALTTGVGDDPFSAVLVQGDDGSFSFAEAIVLPLDVVSLVFEASFDRLGADPTEAGTSPFSDFLTVALYSAVDPALDQLFVPEFSASPGDRERFEFAIDLLAGAEVAISFELSDQDDGFNSIVVLDEVALVTRPVVDVAAPTSSLLLAAVGLGFIGRRTLRRLAAPRST